MNESKTKQILDEMLESGEISKDLETSINGITRPKEITEEYIKIKMLENVEQIRSNTRIIMICVLIPIILSTIGAFGWLLNNIK